MYSRIVVIGDLHGDASKLLQCLKMADIIDDELEWVAEPPNTILVQLGDQIDSRSRGEPKTENTENAETRDWESGNSDVHLMLFLHLLDQKARAKGGQVVSIIGNHEMQNVHGDFIYVSPTSMTNSGGPLRRYADFKAGMDGYLNRILQSRPVVAKIGPFIFCHGCLKIRHLQLVNMDIGLINSCMADYLETGHVTQLFTELFLTNESVLWNRDYEEGDLSAVLAATDSKAMFVGHTIVPQISALFSGKLWLCDVGMSRAIIGAPCQVLQIIDESKYQRIEQV